MNAPAMPAVAGLCGSTGRLSLWQLMRGLIQNPLETLPAAIFDERIIAQPFMGQQRFLVMAPDLIQRVLTDDAAAFEKAVSMQRALRPALGMSILTADSPAWRPQRRAAAPIFRHERLQGFLPAMIAAAEDTRERWRRRPEASPVLMAHEMMRTTFDIIARTMLGGSGAIDVDRVERGITDYLDATGWALALALLRLPAWMPYPGRARAGRARDYLRALLLDLVRSRRGAADRPEDLATLLLEAADSTTGAGMDDRLIADNLLTFITAGHETTALALSWTFHLLASHRDVLARGLAEIRAVTGGGDLRPEHVAALTYLRQVVQESMRLFPPAPLVGRRAVRPVELDGHDLRPGAAVYVPIHAVHRHRTLWEAPDEFLPDRFASDRAARQHRYAYMPFGAGPRICIGMGFAMMEAVAILAVLLPAFDIETLSPPEPMMRITLRPRDGLPMRLRRRGGPAGSA